MSLSPYYDPDSKIIEIGVDEVGRGPMFGRVYSAAVILPKNNEFKYELIKDSKKFHSKKKIRDVSSYIKENCITYSIAYEEHNIVDKHNIKTATHMAMHKAIKNIINYKQQNLVLVDGRDFKLLTYIDSNSETIKEVPSICIENGDNKYCSIAAASILAKVARDSYINELCKDNPELIEKYDLLNNKGYGTEKHMTGIKQYGISKWHRRSFGLCKNY
jgi:ribonuclease HII